MLACKLPLLEQVPTLTLRFLGLILEFCILELFISHLSTSPAR